ncbi:MAG: hypothetical protein KKG60_02765 [Nanoarchaeota archaeon]|nr:hypothetical protein [Nanoarchaeota archaeon]
MDNETIHIMWHILSKLNRMNKIGGAHTEIKNLGKGLPSSLTSTNKGKKRIKEAIKELISNEFLLTKPSTGEIHVSLNPRKLKDIREFIVQHR